MGYNKTSMEVFSSLWDASNEHAMRCPKCGGTLIVLQAEPVEDFENPYVSYETIVECMSCPFQTKAESFTIIGSVKDFDVNQIEIGGWSPSGSRVLSKYEHLIDYDTLKELKKTGELVEFLVVDDHVIQIIG